MNLRENDKERFLVRSISGTLRTVSNLALVFDGLGTDEEAEALHHQTLELKEEMLSKTTAIVDS